MAKQQQSPDAVDRLDLAYRDINEINPQIVERFGPYVKELDLSNNNLEKDLTILEGFKRLTTLVLDSNRISHHIKFPNLPNLHTLWINNNQISNLSIFVDKVSESFPNIRTFSMLKNEACPNFFNGHSLREYKDYRMYIISKLKNVQILDSTPVTQEEKLDAIKLYGNFTTISQSLANATPKPLPLSIDVENEDDPKKKREEKLKQTQAEKELKKQQKLERRERRRIKTLEKEEKTFKKLQEKQLLKQSQVDTDSTITNKDDFTSDEDEDDNNNNSNSNNNKKQSQNIATTLPVFSSEQSPASSIIPPNPHKQSAYDSPELADDEAFTADSSDHSDLPLYKNNSTIAPPPPPNTLLSPPPPSLNIKRQQQISDDDDDDDDDDDEEDSDTESSEWSSEDLGDDDDDEVNQINAKLPTKMTIRDQFYQGSDDDDDDDDDDDEDDQYTHFPVRPPIKK